MSAQEPNPEKVVLFVDDEEDILLLVNDYMHDTLPNVKVLTALSGDAAMGIVRSQRVDVVVSDFRMPGMDGVEFLTAVRELQPQAARLLFTAYEDPELVRRAHAEADVEGVYSKSLSFPDLVRRVESLLDAAAPTQRQ